MSNSKSVVIGIDLGTYNSAACVMLGGEVVLLRPEEGATEQGMCFPSVVEFDDSGEFVQAGERARRSLPVYPQTVVWGVKRLIGRPFDAAQASGDVGRYAYRIEKDPDGTCAIRVGRRVYSPREVTALLLQKIKHDSEADFNPIGREIEEAVITVPAYFDPVQKYETEQAGLMAGFQKVYLLPEPTAAASAYRLKVEQESQYVVVIDLGAGTLDVTVALLYLDDHGNLQTIEKAHGGDTALGGLDMDDALLVHVADRHRLARLLADPQARMRLRTGLERAKIELSTSESADVGFAWREGSVRLSLSRAELEQCVQPIVQRCCGPIRVAMQEAGLAAEDVGHVLLVGGPTMMPVVRRAIAEEFQANAQLVEELEAITTAGFPVHPMEAVARGAMLDVSGKIAPHGYGLLWTEYHELLPRRQRYPSRGNLNFLYWGDKRTIDFGLVRQSINPETLREEYTLLGTFQFDCVAESGTLHLDIAWEYTDNGVLHFEMSQQGGASMPLYDISRLDGHKIARPARLSKSESEKRMPPSTPTARQAWSAAEMNQSLKFGRNLLACARERTERATGEHCRQLADMCDQLEGWLDDDGIDANHRTPHIRDLGRAILNLLYVGRLITGEELASLKRDL